LQGFGRLARRIATAIGFWPYRICDGRRNDLDQGAGGLCIRAEEASARK
jgi:hypothetical protein